MNWLKHLHTINGHKWMVMKFCFRVGLYKQGLLHDLSKYSWTEFSVGAKYFQGNQSPNNMERKEKGYSSAWLHHKGRNKHHLEYWVDYSMEKDKAMAGVEMPVKYVAEMFCDRVAASKIYKKKDYTDAAPYEYFKHSKEHYIIHKNTRELLEKLLVMLKDKGEEETFSYIKDMVKGIKEKEHTRKYKAFHKSL